MMSWEELIALVYLIVIAIGLFVFTLRDIVLKVRNNRSDVASESITAQGTDDNRYDKPKPDRVFMSKIEKLHKSPHKKSATYDNGNKNTFGFHLNRIIPKKGAVKNGTKLKLR